MGPSQLSFADTKARASAQLGAELQGSGIEAVGQPVNTGFMVSIFQL